MRLVLLTVFLLLPTVAADHTGDILYEPAYELGLAPEPSEIQAVVDSLEDHAWAEIHQMGASLDGIPLYAVALTDPDSQVPMDERVVTFIMTQQHGNEPAGTPAALRLLEQLRDGGQARDYLSNQILIVMPQSNPDGAVDNRRENEAIEDINRDHVDIGTPEAAAIHKVLTTWDVHFAFDHHEYGGSPLGGIGYPSPRQSYDYDITTMYPNHGNVREPTSALAQEFNYEHLKPRLESEGYTHGDYGVTSVAGINPQKVAGGPDPGILRNNYGLNNIAGLLIESFIPPASDVNPFQSYERRIASHEVVMDEVLSYAHDHAQHIIEAKRESERLNLEEPMDQYVEASPRGDMPAFFDHPYDDALARAFELHGLPTPADHDSSYVTAAAQERGGLVAALLHPESSRGVVEGTLLDSAQLPASYYDHPDFGAVEELTAAPADAEAPGLAPLVLLGAQLLMARR